MVKEPSAPQVQWRGFLEDVDLLHHLSVLLAATHDELVRFLIELLAYVCLECLPLPVRQYQYVRLSMPRGSEQREGEKEREEPQ